MPANPAIKAVYLESITHACVILFHMQIPSKNLSINIGENTLVILTLAHHA